MLPLLIMESLKMTLVVVFQHAVLANELGGGETWGPGRGDGGVGIAGDDPGGPFLHLFKANELECGEIRRPDWES